MECTILVPSWTIDILMFSANKDLVWRVPGNVMHSWCRYLDIPRYLQRAVQVTHTLVIICASVLFQARTHAGLRTQCTEDFILCEESEELN